MPTLSNKSTYGKIGVATLIMMASIFLSRVLGVLRETTIATICGANAAVDAYKVSFVLPEILNHVLASGFLSITFIPIFSRYLAEKDEPGGWHIFSVILTVFGLLLIGLIAVSMLLAPQFVPLLASGRQDPEFLSMAVRMTRIILPAQLFFFGGGMLMAVQFAKESFVLPALAPLIYNFCIIMGGILLGPRLGVEGFSWGVLSGAFAGNFLIQFIGARKLKMRFQFRFEIRHPDLRRYVLLTLPLMLGLTMTFSTEIFSKFFGSFLPSGSIAWIDFAWRIVMMLVAFFGQAVGVASYPFLARLAAENRLDDMNRLFNDTLRYLALVVPVSVLVWVLRHEIVRILFEHGRFTPSDTRMTALALSGMLVGAAAFTAQTVVNRGFYALQNTLLPALYGTATVMLSLPLYWVGLKFLGVLGIGLAISFSALIQVLVLYSVWNRRSRNIESRRVYGFFGKVILISLPLGIILEVTHRLLAAYLNPALFLGSIGLMVMITALFLLCAALITWWLNIKEVRHLWDKITARFSSGHRA